MDHFGEGLGDEYRWKNDLLNEVRKMNVNMTKLLEQNAQLLKKPNHPNTRKR